MKGENGGRVMSGYLISKLCYRIHHDVPFRNAVLADPEKAIADWPFTDAERTALLTGDVKQLYEWGAHPFLLGHFTRWGVFGVTTPSYSESIRQAKDPD
jgi:Aromatic-ring-opening dioxygenase LigAB, LigA subunit